jgi:predicted nucleic acid-binding protein
MSVLVDASFLFSITYSHDKWHKDCVEVVRNLRHKFIVPVTVLPEVTHLLRKRLGHKIMREFVREVSVSNWHIENLYDEDMERASELLSVYADARLDFADATIVAMAERLGVETILTLDRRDFSVVRPKHIPHFNLLP